MIRKQFIQKIETLERKVYELSSKLNKLTFTIEHPPKFKKGDTVVWEEYEGKISSWELIDDYNWVFGYNYVWEYVIVSGVDVTKVHEDDLKPVSKKK